MEIKSFSKYYINNNIVYRKIDNKIMKLMKTEKYKLYRKMKNDNNHWVSIMHDNILKLAGVCNLPFNITKVPNTNNVWITLNGIIYVKSIRYPLGARLTNTIGTSGYKRVAIKYKGKKGSVDVHKLMAETFLLDDYFKKGFVCMHKDGNKLNCNISNLRLGTYSENNKDAYRTGVNKGNGLKLI